MLKDDVLDAIQQFEQQRGLADACELSPFRTGAKVKLVGENLFGVEGLVTSVSNKRVNLLVEILGGYRKMSVEHHELKLA